MSCIIRTHSNAFDINHERIHPRRGIPGEALLAWLLGGLSAAAAEPEPVDGGWQLCLRYRGQPYRLLVAGESEENAQGMREWYIEIDRVRNGLQRLLGLARLRRDDPCLLAILALLQQDGGFHYISTQRG